MRATSIILAIALFCLPLSGALAQQDDRETPAYVGSESCAGCHKGETEAWMGSHHQLAWTPPDADHVLGDFNDTSFTLNGVTTRFTTRDGQFFIQSDGPDGEITTWPVAGVAGIAPLQQYLIETEPGKVQSFDVVWDVEQRRWYHLYPDQGLMAADSFHWTGPYKNWNARCAECHATGFEKAYDPASESYSSTQAGIGVGCESCHGPGEAHRDWALANGTYDPDRWAGLSDSALTMDFTAGAEAQIQQCAGCHSRREAFLDGNPLPGTPYHDAYRLSPLRPGLYHPDGQILDEVYVYGSFLQSRMYAEGVACTDCHDPHTAQRIAEDNTLCTQCHSPAGNERFPTLKLAEYDDPSHHFHPTGSEGAQCKTCHMIERDYMGIDGRRDHSFRVPRPDLTVETRAPNACTDCHADQTAKWAADRVAEWYPEGRQTQPHFSQVMAAGRIDTVGQIEGLLGIALHDGLPAIVRASAMDLLAPVSSPAIAAETEPALSDPDPQVRVAAVALQRGAPQTDLAQRLVPLLSDPVRAVRIATAREFLALRIAHMPADTTSALNSAMTEWQRSIRNKMDFPEMQMVMGGIGLTTRNMMAALSAFGEAVDMDPQMIEAWTMIVRIHAALGNRDAALAALDEAIAANPDEVSLSLMRADLAE